MSDAVNNSLCRDAEQYYLSVIFGTEYGQVPEHINNHIQNCGTCQKQLTELKNNLNTKEDSSGSEEKALVNNKLNTLKLHLEQIGNKVDCNAAKPFLPLLLVPNAKIGVPTPITAHLDHCETCQKDLAIIKSLGLKDKQLEILSNFLENQSSSESYDCPAAEIIQSYANFDFQAIKPQDIQHICSCNTCQLLIYQIRAKKLDELKTSISQCDSVSFADLFDYCFPYETSINTNQQESFIDHLKCCPKCLGKLEQLHSDIYRIKQRPESGISTIYQLSQTKVVTADTTSIYNSYPINVQTIIFAHKQPILGLNRFRRGLKYITRGAVAAAVILAIALFIHNFSTATAIDAEQVFQAIQNAPSIHKIKYSNETSEPVEEEWASKSLNIYILKTSKGIYAWNVSEGKSISKPKDNTKQEIFPVTETTLAKIREKIRGSFGLTPFQNSSQFPPGTKWKKINNQSVEGISADNEVYELCWTWEDREGNPIPYKWRAYINKETLLPKRIELYEKLNNESEEYATSSITVIEYISNNEIYEVLREFGFDDSLLGAP